MLKSRVGILTVSLSLFLTAILLSGCESALKPEQTPNRVVINFIKEIGRRNYPGAGAFVAPESQDQVQTWGGLLIFPDVSEPPTPEEVTEVDRFIASIYRITVMEETDTTAKVYLAFTASDALMGFPSVADNPLTPTSATWTVTLVRTAQGEGTEAEYSDWLIGSIVSGAL